ncbi:glycosyltransferase WbuB [Flavobacterium covae]|uniref:Glycosyltransferase family 4 protein n=1 Tax=Flavobacterium covae TaxID=2906076 RepID=A0ABW8PFN4_9FLAO|nr:MULTISPECIES: glycosyltransferase family 4 protein [Flavobacterium]OWP80881.1 glycosyltransferase WbuB [Flavobacterium covae]POR22831.1 glycosyltransferase WbuB [Flavobacterium columnare]
MYKIWIVTSGEPVPSETERLHRTGMLSALLADNENCVTWWTTSFDHQLKQYLVEANSKVKIKHNLDLYYLHAKTPYFKNISWQRIKNHSEVANSFQKCAQSEEVPDIIVCSFPTIDLAYEAVSYGKKHNVPVVVDVRDLWPDIFLNIAPKFLRPLFKIPLHKMFSKTNFILQGATSITAVSQSYLNWGLKYAKRSEKNTDAVFPLCYNATELPKQSTTEKQLFKETLLLDASKINIWFVGTFGKTYDLETVIKTAEKIQDNYPNIHFILTGDGENYKQWKEQAQKLPNVTFTGWIGREKLAYIGSIASIGLMAYAKGAPQGLPNKIFEYMSYGLPILSSLDTETKDLLEEENIGLTYKANDPEDLIEKITSLIANPIALKQKGERARELYLTKYDSETIYNNFMQFLYKAIAQYKNEK